MKKLLIIFSVVTCMAFLSCEPQDVNIVGPTFTAPTGVEASFSNKEIVVYFNPVKDAVSYSFYWRGSTAIICLNTSNYIKYDNIKHKDSIVFTKQNIIDSSKQYNYSNMTGFLDVYFGVTATSYKGIESNITWSSHAVSGSFN